MDCVKIGRLIYTLRKEKGMTQKTLADALGISNKTVSKWECGLGCPDLSLWPELSDLLEVEMVPLMEGEMVENKPDNGNISRIRLYVCPQCGNILSSTGSASIFCCGRKLEQLSLQREKEQIPITLTESDTDVYITFDHPMEKAHYISFVAYIQGDRLQLVRLYPEQENALRLPMRQGGKLLFYCTQHGLCSGKT